MTTATLPAAANLFATLRTERVRMGQWAFAAAVRMSDQNRPLGLKLIIECMFVFHALSRLVRAARSSGAAHTARRVARTAAQRRAPSSSPLRAIAQIRQAARRHGAVLHCMARRNRACVQQKSRFLCKVGLDS